MSATYWIDCPICSVRMTQCGQAQENKWVFSCPMCDTVTEIPHQTSNSKRAVYRREMLDKRRIK